MSACLRDCGVCGLCAPVVEDLTRSSEPATSGRTHSCERYEGRPMKSPRPSDCECPPVAGRTLSTSTTGGTMTTKATTATGFDCQECGMRCEPVDVFHPYLFCWLRKSGVLDPAKFLARHGFQPDPKVFPDA